MEPDEARDVRTRYLSGDPAGLDAAYRLYGKNLYAIARHVLGEDGALDCVHDVLLRVWRRPHVYREERGTLRTFLHVAVRSEAIGRRRAAARHHELERRASVGDGRSEGFEVTDHVERGALHRAIAALPPEQRGALELAYVEHLTHVQIAERTGAPLGTIKGRIGLAMRKLRDALASAEGTR